MSGAKNAVLPIMAASLLAEGPVEIVNVPRLRDIDTFGKLLEGMGSGTCTTVMETESLASVPELATIFAVPAT